MIIIKQQPAVLGVESENNSKTILPSISSFADISKKHFGFVFLSVLAVLAPDSLAVRLGIFFCYEFYNYLFVNEIFTKNNTSFYKSLFNT